MMFPRTKQFAVSATLLLLSICSLQVHAQTNCYLYGMHDYNSTIRDLLTYEGEARGWVLILQSLDGYTGGTNSEVVNAANAGLGVVVRLHWGYGTTGTFPPQAQYDLFASRAATFISNHINHCIYYSIGNEPNLCAEWPAGGEADGRCDPNCSSIRERISPERYVDCFTRVYQALTPDLRTRAKLLVTPTATWAGEFTCVSGFETYDFLCYQRILFANIPEYMIGGFTFHPKTHSHSVGEITSNALSNPAFGCAHNERIHWYFRVYYEMLADIPEGQRHKPIFFKELNPHESGWMDVNNGYVVAAYDEIADWNASRDDLQITGMMLYRWDDGDDRWDIWSRPQVQADLRAAIAKGQRNNLCEPQAPTPTPTASPTPTSGPVEDFMNGTYLNGIAPGWSAWQMNNGDAVTTFSSGGALDADEDTSTTPPNYQAISTVFNTSGNGQGGVWRKFAGLTPGSTYRITVHLNTFSRSGVWWFEAHRAHNGTSGANLTHAQLDGSAPLPDGQGQNRPFVKLESGAAHTGGEWIRYDTGSENPGKIEGDLTLPQGVTTLTVWVKHGGLSSGTVGLDWVKVEDLSLLPNWKTY